MNGRNDRERDGREGALMIAKQGRLQVSSEVPRERDQSKR